jgi:hypothetical protein
VLREREREREREIFVLVKFWGILSDKRWLWWGLWLKGRGERNLGGEFGIRLAACPSWFGIRLFLKSLSCSFNGDSFSNLVVEEVIRSPREKKKKRKWS